LKKTQVSPPQAEGAAAREREVLTKTQVYENCGD